jgi:hypothetical protein
VGDIVRIVDANPNADESSAWRLDDPELPTPFERREASFTLVRQTEVLVVSDGLSDVWNAHDKLGDSM